MSFGGGAPSVPQPSSEEIARRARELAEEQERIKTAAAEEKRKQLLASRSSRSGTVLTGGSGVTDEANVARKKLLGS
ncbi:MAG: hypothetical protein AVO39_10295 [delta proteobacterium MLS_D]|jgi:GMP synthase-like glutamine amidotransferase|nr:MAG: hypothetical protein AVO39_10295 [delta proteobacterium MLS_D]